MRARELANTYMLMLRTEVRRWWMNGKMAQNGECRQKMHKNVIPIYNGSSPTKVDLNLPLPDEIEKKVKKM